jgi:hypothetical protein
VTRNHRRTALRIFFEYVGRRRAHERGRDEVV